MEEQGRIRAWFAVGGLVALAVITSVVYVSEGRLGELFFASVVGISPPFVVRLLFPGLCTESQLRGQRGRRRLALALSGVVLLEILVSVPAILLT